MIETVFRNMPFTLAGFCAGWAIACFDLGENVEASCFVALGIICLLTWKRHP
jgi:hypothetical protein